MSWSDSVAGLAEMPRKVRDLIEGGPLRKVGILGGSFDPIHSGHIACARAAATQLGFDAVLFVPAFSNWCKPQGYGARPEDRLAMCRLGLADCPDFAACDVDIARGLPTYTVDTVRDVRALLPDDVQTFFIVGSDCLDGLVRWKRADELAALTCFAAVTRPGHPIAAETVDRLVAGGFSVCEVLAETPDVSSSAVRDALAAGEAVCEVPPAVGAYIRSHGLYGGDGR